MYFAAKHGDFKGDSILCWHWTHSTVSRRREYTEIFAFKNTQRKYGHKITIVHMWKEECT